MLPVGGSDDDVYLAIFMRNGYVEEFDETTFVFFFFSVGGCN
jgi:hypothetical protein